MRNVFKQEAAGRLFGDYAGRISKFTACEAAGKSAALRETPARTAWVCNRAGKIISSEELAIALEKITSSGSRLFQIAVGGPDGFSADETAKLRPDFEWSFGRLTLPHELAAVVAAEQIYRAWTILRGLPYHCGH